MSTDHAMDCDDSPDVGGSNAADVTSHVDNTQPGEGVQHLSDGLKPMPEPACVTDAHVPNCSPVEGKRKNTVLLHQSQV